MEKRQELVEAVEREEEEQQKLVVTMEEEEEEWVIPVHVDGLQRP